MSNGLTICTCRYCPATEEFPDEIAPPDFVCGSCWPIVNARSGE